MLREPAFEFRETAQGRGFMIRRGPFPHGDTLLVLALAQPLQGINQQTRLVLKWYFWSLPVLIGVLGWVAWQMAGRALLPLRQLARAAEVVSSETLSLRISPRGARDEVDVLTVRFNEMLDGDIINELKAGNPDKTRFKSREGLKAESRLEPFEMERDKRRRVAVDIDVNDSPVEGEYVSRKAPESDVKPLGKKWGGRAAAEEEPDSKKIDDDGDMKMPAPEKGVRDSGKGEDADSGSIHKKKQLYRGKQKEPGVMYHDLKGADK